VLDEERFDFSKESNIKEQLWGKMENAMASAPSREPVSLDSLLSQPKTHTPAPEESVTPKDPERTR